MEFSPQLLEEADPLAKLLSQLAPLFTNDFPANLNASISTSTSPLEKTGTINFGRFGKLHFRSFIQLTFPKAASGSEANNPIQHSVLKKKINYLLYSIQWTPNYNKQTLSSLLKELQCVKKKKMSKQSNTKN